jgi:hypothetical protein
LLISLISYYCWLFVSLIVLWFFFPPFVIFGVINFVFVRTAGLVAENTIDITTVALITSHS